MKRILPLLLLGVFGMFAVGAAETLLHETVFKAPKKGFFFWHVKAIESTATVSEGVAKIEIRANNAEKPNLNNAQFIVPYAKGLRGGVKYRVEATVKSSADLTVRMAVNLNKRPWTLLTDKSFKMKAGEAEKLSLDFSPAADITETYRVPMFGFGLATPGTSLEVSDVKLFEVK